jgi:hypothetical protein
LKEKNVGGVDMKLHDLTAHLNRRQRLLRGEQILVALEASVEKASTYDGMPQSPNIRDKVGSLAVELADLRERLRFLCEQVKKEERQILDFTDGIDDPQVRTIIMLRFLKGLTWSEVAQFIGGGNTENGVMMAVRRYLS